MTLVLTSSRNPSIRSRQFIKEFSKLFPKNKVKIVNRGKYNLNDLFLKYSNVKVIFIISNRQGNPDKITVYVKKNKSFQWFMEFKLTFVKLHFELKSKEFDNPQTTIISYSNIEAGLKERLNNLFTSILDDQATLDDNEIGITELEIKFCYTKPGFTLTPYILKNGKQVITSPKIMVNEIIVNDD
jgi:rRNA maturation protein Rpf1